MKVLVVGGAASGKSEFAENAAMRLGGERLYVATMSAEGSEAQARISRHRAQRQGKGFETLECSQGLESLSLQMTCEGSDGSVVLLECVGNLASNELYGSPGGVGASGREAVEEACRRVVEGIVHVGAQCDHLVVVTNEVGAGDVRLGGHLQPYVRLMGTVNNRLAACFDVVVEVWSGSPLVVKGGSPWLR